MRLAALLCCVTAITLRPATATAQSGLGVVVVGDAATMDVGLTAATRGNGRVMAEWRPFFGVYFNDPYNGGRASYDAVVPTVSVVAVLAAALVVAPGPREPGDSVAGFDRGDRIALALLSPILLANARVHHAVANAPAANATLFLGTRTHVYTPSGRGQTSWTRFGAEAGLRIYGGALEQDALRDDTQGMGIEIGGRYVVDRVRGGWRAGGWEGFLGISLF